MAKRKLLNQDEAEAILAPLVPTLLDSYWEADKWVGDLLAHDRKSRLILDRSTIASMVSNTFTHQIKPKMLSKNVSWKGEGKFQSGVVQQAVRLRFKKLTPDLHSINSHTKAQAKIYWQQQELANARLLTCITFGYTLARVTGQTTGLYFVCPYGWNRNLWTWPLYEADEGQYSVFGGPFDPDSGTDDQQFEITARKRKPSKA